MHLGEIDIYEDDDHIEEQEQKHAVSAPSLHISREDLARLQCYIDNCRGEISGVAHLHREAGELIIHSPLLLEQEVSSTTTDIDPESLGDAVAAIANAGGDPSTLICWWHSHYNMPTFWSSTDKETIEMLGSYSDIMISLVGNVDCEWKARIDIFSPVRMTADVELRIYDAVTDEVEAQIKREIAEKVSRKVYTQKTGFRINPQPSLPLPAEPENHWDRDDLLVANGYDDWYL